jgi:hypothetical protein
MSTASNAPASDVAPIVDGLVRLREQLAALGVRYELQVAKSGLCWIAFSHPAWGFMALTPPNELPLDATLAIALLLCMSGRLTASGGDRAQWMRLAFLATIPDEQQNAAVERRWRSDHQLHQAIHDYFGADIAQTLEGLASRALYGMRVYL